MQESDERRCAAENKSPSPPCLGVEDALLDRAAKLLHVPLLPLHHVGKLPELADHGKVVGHVGVEDAVDHQAPSLPPCLIGQHAKHIAAGVTRRDAVQDGQVPVLQHRLVVVRDSQRVPAADQVAVVQAGMTDIVGNSCEHESKDLERLDLGPPLGGLDQDVYTAAANDPSQRADTKKTQASADRRVSGSGPSRAGPADPAGSLVCHVRGVLPVVVGHVVVPGGDLLQEAPEGVRVEQPVPV